MDTMIAATVICGLIGAVIFSALDDDKANGLINLLKFGVVILVAVGCVSLSITCLPLGLLAVAFILKLTGSALGIK